MQQPSSEPLKDISVRGFIPQTIERFALGAAALSLILIAILSYRDAVSFNRLSDEVDASQRIVQSTADLVSALTDAETGQRGFLLTGVSLTSNHSIAPYRRCPGL